MIRLVSLSGRLKSWFGLSHDQTCPSDTVRSYVVLINFEGGGNILIYESTWNLVYFQKIMNKGKNQYILHRTLIFFNG